MLLLPTLGEAPLLSGASVVVLMDIPARAGPCQELGLLVFSLGGNVPSSHVNRSHVNRYRCLPVFPKQCVQVSEWFILT